MESGIVSYFFWCIRRFGRFQDLLASQFPRSAVFDWQCRRPLFLYKLSAGYNVGPRPNAISFGVQNEWCNILCGSSFLRARASIATITLSVCLSQPGTVWRLGERDFGFSPYDSFIESLVFCDKISLHWIKEVPTHEEAKKGHPLKKALFYRY